MLEYDLDPCCSEMEGWVTACKDSVLNIEESYPVGIKKDMLDEEFRDPLCMR